MANTPFYLFLSKPPTFDNILQYHPNEIQDKYKNKLKKERCFFMFRRLQNYITFFLQEALL